MLLTLKAERLDLAHLQAKIYILVGEAICTHAQKPDTNLWSLHLAETVSEASISAGQQCKAEHACNAHADLDEKGAMSPGQWCSLCKEIHQEVIAKGPTMSFQLSFEVEW